MILPVAKTDVTNEPTPNRPEPLDAIARVIAESGRWVVYLNVPLWDPGELETETNEDHPITNHWQRINDYATEAEAKVAASWFQRSANRKIRPPSGF